MPIVALAKPWGPAWRRRSAVRSLPLAKPPFFCGGGATLPQLFGLRPNPCGMCAPGPASRGRSPSALSAVPLCPLRVLPRRFALLAALVRSGAARPPAAVAAPLRRLAPVGGAGPRPSGRRPCARPLCALCAPWARVVASPCLARSVLRPSVAALWSALLRLGAAVGLAPRAASSRAARCAALGPAGSAPGRTRAVGPLSFRFAARGFFGASFAAASVVAGFSPAPLPSPPPPLGAPGKRRARSRGLRAPAVPAAPPGSVVPLRPVSSACACPFYPGVKAPRWRFAALTFPGICPAPQGRKERRKYERKRYSC